MLADARRDTAALKNLLEKKMVRPASHSKPGWMTPRGSASALGGEIGRSACVSLGFRAAAPCRPRNGGLKSTNDSRLNRMKNGGRSCRKMNRWAPDQTPLKSGDAC